MTLAATTILPGWVVLPAATVTMLVVASHVLATHAGDLPVRRRNLRVANGLLMMFVTALLAYALGVAGVVDEPTARPDETRRFVLVWMAVVGLVSVVVAIACIDAIATVSHGWAVRKTLRREMREALAGDVASRRALGVRAAARTADSQEGPRGRA